MSLLKIDHIAEHTSGAGIIFDSTVTLPAQFVTGLRTVNVAADADAELFDPPALIAAGTQLGERVVFRAHSFDTSDHKRDFIVRVSTTSNAGAGKIEIITRLDLGGLTTVFAVDDLGAVSVQTLTAANGMTITAGGLTITAGGLTVTAGGLTVSAGGAAITGNVNVSSGVLQMAGVQVVTTRRTGWTAPTGTASRAGFATHTAQTITNPPTQAEVQNIDNSVVAVSQHLKALIDDLTTHGLIGA